jgi:NCS2 family nucleobase:cation symporter-2
VALSVGLGLQLEVMNLPPGSANALQHLPDSLRILGASGILPAALIAIVLNLVLPEQLSDEATEEVSGGLAGHGTGLRGKDEAGAANV